MFQLPSFLDPDFYRAGGEVSIVVAEAGILAFLLSGWTALAALQVSIRKQSTSFFWLFLFSISYSIWNIFYLLAASQRDLVVLQTTLPSEWTEHTQLILSLTLPYLCSQFLGSLFTRKNLSIKMLLPTLSALIFYLILIQIFYHSDRRVIFLVGAYCFFAFLYISFRLWALYRISDDLKIKTRAFFIFLGLMVCTLFSAIGQIRADGFFADWPLPYIGTVLSSVFNYFIYQMALNSRLREVRELMLRGIQIILLTVILTIIFVSLLAWVGENNIELFLFNTFIASFFILTILEPLRDQLDRFFIKNFIVDRYEFEELLRRLPRRIRKSRSLPELSKELVSGIRESGRIYQIAFYVLDPGNQIYRLMEPSNLDFAPHLTLEDPLIREMKALHSYLLMEQDHDLSQDVRIALQERHTHIIAPLFKGQDLIGAWALRSSLRSTNPYTSFSNTELDLIQELSSEIVSALDQIQFFESQERQERLATLGEMSAALAHEIRNPLGAIQGSVQLLHSSPTISHSDDKECIEILSKECLRLQRTVDQYLNFARKSEDLTPTQMKPLIQGIIHELDSKAKKTKTNLILESAEVIPAVKTDPHKLEQVLFNLIQNACEAFSKNVWVKVSVRFDNGKSWLQILVEDDGPGISSENMKNIFNPLFTTKKAGSGLGLPICKKIIDSLEGSLQVLSTPGKGTVFSILLPIPLSE